MKHLKSNILINCVINNLNIKEIEELVYLSKELNIHISFEPICFFDKNPLDFYNLYLSSKNRFQKVMMKIIYLKKNKYPIINSITYLKNILKSY